MKKTIKKILEEILAQQEKWNYYSYENTINPFDSNENSKEFIKNFIIKSCKAETNQLYQKINNLVDGRALHIVSTFFLGIYFYENSASIKRQLNKTLKKYKNPKKYKSTIEFSFVWFLACLFHDLGYEFEAESKYESFEIFFEEEKLISLKKYSGVPSIYSQIYKDYFNYRVLKNKNDHGICAAFVLFSDLQKIRKEQEESANNSTGLCWEKSLVNVYNFAAWTILAHNIWYADSKEQLTVNNYKEANLNDLILKENEFKITLVKHPFLFLFCLIDSIEPLKRVKRFSLLEKIEIQILNDTIIIESKLECGCHDTILNQAYDLRKWLSTARKTDNTVQVDLLPQSYCE